MTPPTATHQPVRSHGVSRRTLLLRAAAAGIAGTTLPISAHAETQGTPVDATPLDDQLMWMLATLNDGASSLAAADVTDHFTPGFLEAVPPEQVVAVSQQIAAAFAPVSLEGFTRPPTPTQANALVTSGNGIPLVIPLAVETAPPHRITGLTFAPVPPPSGVQLAPTVDVEGTPLAGPERRDALYDVDGRKFYLSCLGSDSPTVVLESGANDPAAPWFAIEHAVAPVTRVCSYDRANTAGGASDPAPTPRTARDMVADMHALLGAAGERGPYVLAGHSIGGLLVRLYASTYPDEVAGLVLIDPSHEEQNVRRQALLSPEHWAIYQQMNLAIEGIDLDASFEQVREARTEAPLRPMPMIVLTAGQPPEPALLPPGWPVEEDEQLWRELHDDLAGLVPDGRHVVADQSGHYIHQSQPDLVVEAILQVVDAVRDPGSWGTPTTGASPESHG